MASSVIHAIGDKFKSPTIQIKLDSACIVYKGYEDSTGPQTVRGCVAISSPSSFNIKHIDLEIMGEAKITHKLTTDERAAGHQSETSFIVHDETVQVKDATGAVLTKILPGDHEYPFEFELPGEIAESVEGVPGDETSRKYYITAHVSMGKLYRDLRVKEKLRIVRTLPNGLYGGDLSVPQNVFGTWPEKMKYSIRTPCTAYIFGSKVKVDFEFTPLMEKLDFPKIGFFISEKESVCTKDDREDVPLETDFLHREREPICKEVQNVPNVPDEIDPELNLPMKKFSIAFTLPVSLKQCRQSNEHDPWIRFNHLVHYRIIIKNPDGHTSELKAHHKIYLYISPRLPINPDDHVDPRTRQNLPTLDLAEDEHSAPPVYLNRMSDPLVDPFSGIVTGANTPGVRSGATTPGRVLGSGLQPMLPIVEDLTSRLAVVERTQTEAAREITPAAARGPPASGIHVEHIQHSTFDIEALSRVPSYDTAARAPCPGAASEATPSYDSQS